VNPRSALLFAWLAACDDKPITPPPPPSTSPAVSTRSAAPAPAAASSARAATTPLSTITALAPADGAELARGAHLVATTESGTRLRVTLASKATPLPHPRSLGFYRLAQTLGFTAVPVTEVQRLPLDWLVSRLPSDPAGRRILEAALVSHDGSVAALVQELPGEMRRLSLDDPLIERCQTLATSRAPVPAAERALVRAWVEIAVLDYLAANVLRAEGVLADGGRRLLAIDNAGAFPGWISSEALDIPLSRLRPVLHFPADLRGQLRRLDARRVDGEDLRQGYEDRLLGRRDGADLIDRRATVATLVAARASQYGIQSIFDL
jgi:hypothetical protein